MGPCSSSRCGKSVRFTVKLVVGMLLGLWAAALCSAQDIPIGATYVCGGEHIYVEACNMRDTSDTSTCMVAHPDHLTPSGMNTYTNLTRGALKKLLPTCQQPSAKQLAAARPSRRSSRTCTTPTSRRLTISSKPSQCNTDSRKSPSQRTSER